MLNRSKAEKKDTVSSLLLVCPCQSWIIPTGKKEQGKEILDNLAGGKIKEQELIQVIGVCQV